MDVYAKVDELRSLIVERLTPLITHDYRYLMMCDHPNVGDTLIMKGEFEFLRSVRSAHCKEYTTIDSFQNRCPEIPDDDLLIMRGSGSFGDIWPTAPEFWKFIMHQYPSNPILFMPQTIHFNDERNLLDMKKAIRDHNKVTLTVRDEESLMFARTNFECPVYLVPDMAFFINERSLRAHKISSPKKSLIVARNDVESQSYDFESRGLNDSNSVISDWPTFFKRTLVERGRRYLCRKKYFRLYDLYVKTIYSNYIVRQGVKFLTPYTDVYATRMHAGILAMMMGKTVHFVDNNYGKLSRLFFTWLKDIPNVNLER